MISSALLLAEMIAVPKRLPRLSGAHVDLSPDETPILDLFR
mgnify:CR=1 FL=1